MTTNNTDVHLSEPQALALLRQHCGVLRGRLVFDASQEHGAHATQTWMTLLCRDVSEDDLRDGLGYQLRLAMDVANALCACRGFAPHRNQRFWREAVATLWIAYSSERYDARRPGERRYLFQPPTNLMLPFDRAAFACFSVDFLVSPHHGLETRVAELWRQIAWGAELETNFPVEFSERRDRVLAQLQRHAVRRVRSLQIELLIPTNADHPYSDDCLRVPLPRNWRPFMGAMLRGSQEIPTVSRPRQTSQRQSQRVAGTDQVVTIAVRSFISLRAFTLHTSNLRPVRQLLGCNATVQCLTLDAVLAHDATQNADDQIVLFGELLRFLLVERQSLTTLRLPNGKQTRALAAVCSLLPIVTCLTRFHWIAVARARPTHKRDHVWHWLMYALQHPLRHHATTADFELTVGVNYSKNPSNEIQAARATATPLCPVAQEAVELAASKSGRNVSLRAGAFQWFATGTTVVRVDPSSRAVRLFTSPDFRHRLVLPAAMRDPVMEAVVVVACMDAVGVVVRGVGLCWVRQSQVAALDALVPLGSEERRRGSTSSGRSSLGVSALRLHNLSWRTAESMVRRLDSDHLVALMLTIGGHCGGDRLESLLQLCPNLQHLSLPWCPLTSLLLRVTAASAKPSRCVDAQVLLDMLCDATHPGTRQLRHLSLACPVGTPAYPLGNVTLAANLARVLAVNTTLETVYIDAHDRSGRRSPKREKWAHRMLSPFQDQVLNDARAASIGLLSVVQYWNRQVAAVGCCVDALAVSTILAFVGPTVIRTVRWHCDREPTCFESLMWLGY